MQASSIFCTFISDFLRNAQCLTNQYTAMAAGSDSCFNQIFSQDTSASDPVQSVCKYAQIKDIVLSYKWPCLHLIGHVDLYYRITSYIFKV